MGEAIQHAFAAGNFGLAAELIASNARTLLWAQGETQRPWQWLQQLAEEEVQRRPELLITKAWLYQELFLDHGSQVGTLLESAADLIQAADATFTSTEIAEMSTEIALAKGNMARLQGDTNQAIQHSRNAWARIKDVESTVLRAGALHSLTVTYHQAGQITEALTYSAIQFDSYKQGEPLDYAHYVSLAYRIDALRLSGALEKADLAFRQFVPNHLQRPNAGSAMAAISWAEVLRERNRLPLAAETLNLALETLRPLKSMAIVVQTGAITLARIYQALGDGQEALKLLKDTLRDCRAPDVYYPSARVSATAATLCLQQGNLSAAKAWAEKSGLLAEDAPTYLLEIDYLVLARVLIADGSAQAAQPLLGTLEEATRSGGRVARLIEVHILQALAHQALGESRLALDRLGRAIAFAQEGGHVRVVVDEGKALIPLLKQIAGRGVAIAYVRQILPLFDEERQKQPSSTMEHPIDEHDPSLVESDSLILNPLTDRELATLRYLASDLSIPEIAEQMIVAPSTIRTYVKRIYGKLDVHNRIEAVNRARSLALLG